MMLSSVATTRVPGQTESPYSFTRSAYFSSGLDQDLSDSVSFMFSSEYSVYFQFFGLSLQAPSDKSIEETRCDVTAFFRLFCLKIILISPYKIF